jgi:hypothetical protein
MMERSLFGFHLDTPAWWRLFATGVAAGLTAQALLALWRWVRGPMTGPTGRPAR